MSDEGQHCNAKLENIILALEYRFLILLLHQRVFMTCNETSIVTTSQGYINVLLVPNLRHIEQRTPMCFEQLSCFCGDPEYNLALSRCFTFLRISQPLVQILLLYFSGVLPVSRNMMDQDFPLQISTTHFTSSLS